MNHDTTMFTRKEDSVVFEDVGKGGYVVVNHYQYKGNTEYAYAYYNAHNELEASWSQYKTFDDAVKSASIYCGGIGFSMQDRNVNHIRYQLLDISYDIDRFVRDMDTLPKLNSYIAELIESLEKLETNSNHLYEYG